MEIDYKDRGWKGESRRGARGPTVEDRSGVASMWGARREDAVGRGSWFESTWLARGDRRGGWFAGARRVQSRARRERGAVDWIQSVGNVRDQGGQRASVLDS